MTQNEKRLMEIAAIQIFLQHYNQINGSDYSLLRMQERPDALITNSQGVILGIEVTHLFYEPYEAKMLLGRSEDDYLHTTQYMEHLIAELQRILDRKMEKGTTYEFEMPMILVIRSASPVFFGEDFLYRVQDLHIKPEIFKEIWLLVRENENPGWPNMIQIR